MRNPPDGWAGRPVQAIMQTHDGAVWAATEGAGLYRMLSNSWENFSINEGLSNSFVWSVLEDHQQRIWAGTWGGGLFRLESTNFVRVFDFLERGEPVTALLESPPGSVWIGTALGLAHCVDDKVERFASLGDSATGDVRALEAGRDGEVWFGTQGQGLGCLKNGKLTTFHHANGLPSEFILSLRQEANGRLWIGTLDRGICLYEKGKFHVVGIEQGLPNNSIGHIEDDGIGHYWFSSQQGLFRADAQELIECEEGTRSNVSVLVFGKAEGLATLAGSSGFTPSGFRSSDGRLWFPTVRGLAVVSPKAVRHNSVPPAVWVQEVLVDGKHADIRTHTQDGEDDITQAKVVRLDPGHRQLEVLFTGLSFTSPDQVQFRYRLSGLDNDWTWGGTQRRVTYPFLPPGNYTFRVIACNGDGLWNEVGDAVGVIVRPYYWQTWWFKTASSCFGLVLVGAIVSLESRRRHRRKLERIARDRELEQERSRIAQDIHDDLGASLTRIGMLSESATEDLDDRTRAAASLGQIYSTARDLTRAMDEIVWAVNPRHDTLESLTNYITRFAHDFLSTAQIRCRLDAPMQLPNLVVRSEVRHNLFLAFKEALNNAVKHSGATEVRVTLEFGADSITLTIADNGSGFDPKEAAAPKGDRLISGYGMTSIRTRLEQVGGRMEMHTKKGEGTKVILAVALRGMALAENGHS
jgi:signal transduction histidine kinase